MDDDDFAYESGDPKSPGYFEDIADRADGWADE